LTLTQGKGFKVVIIDGNSLKVSDVENVAFAKIRVQLAESGRRAMQASRDYIESCITRGETMYGVNTGFGAFSKVRIDENQIEELQRNLIRSHCAGIGKPFSAPVVRALMLLRANTLARGQSGVRPVLVEKLIELLDKDIIPWIPEQGSVGASGDLAPLSHLALSLMGEGYILVADGTRSSTAEIFKKHNVEPLVLKAKEGLSLINGCQVMTALGLLTLSESQSVIKMFDLAAAMTLEATRGSRKPFHPLIAPTRPHPGEAKTAKNVLRLLGATSAIAETHINCNRVQDAYSLRCVPAVHGAIKDVVERSLLILEREANSSTDNPLVFAEEKIVLSCGNFHGEPVALELDFAAIAMANLGNISERRLAKLIDPTFSELPAFLATSGGLQSGLMIVHVAAASLVSENKGLCHPASVDSIPTSSDKEDHVSMGTISARKFARVLDNVKNILAMELLGASQGLGFLTPLQPAAGVLAAYNKIREQVSFAKDDRMFSEDVEALRAMIDNGSLLKTVESAIGSLEV
jgi:histidine ammonia-lyase